MILRKAICFATILLMLPAGNVHAKGDKDRGADLSSDCINCHGMNGEGNFETPTIAGLDEVYILERLRGFKSGQMESMDDLMHIYTEDRSDQELQDLAAYWSSKEK